MIRHNLQKVSPPWLWKLFQLSKSAVPFATLDVLEKLARRIPAQLDFIYKIQRSRFNTDRNRRKGTSLSSTKMTSQRGKVKRVLVIAHYYFASPEYWKPGCGNFFYEIYASAIDKYGFENVEVFSVIEAEPEEQWLSRLTIELGREFDMFLVFGELSPHSNTDWDWDAYLDSIRKTWSGLAFFVVFDSVWRQTLLKIDRLVSIDKNVRVITIDRDVRNYLSKPLQVLGPLFLPISVSSRELISSKVQNSITSEDFSLSFHGKLYPYRIVQIGKMEKLGIRIEVNRSNSSVQRDYPAYIQDLNSSGLVLCLSRANAQNINQLKCRILEASLFGGIVLTDEKSLIGQFFPKGDFFYFRSTRHLRKILTAISQHPEKVVEMRESARSHAEYIANQYFWEKIEQISL
jgi:hypothetical protein